MKPEAKEALKIIRRCLTSERFTVTRHFQERMDLRGIVWADVLAVVDTPARVKDDGRDYHDRPKWIIGGEVTDGLDVDVVCVLDTDEDGDWTVLITVY